MLNCLLMLLTAGQLAFGKSFEDRAKQVIQTHLGEIAPLEKALNLAWWNANTTGTDADFKKKEEAQNKYDEKVSGLAFFAEVKAVRDGLPKKAPAEMRRQIELLYLMTLEKQVPTDLLKQMAAKSNQVEQIFNVFRAKVNGKELTENEVKGVLKHSKDSKELRAVWEGSKSVATQIAPPLLELVKLRNQAAKHLGFANFHAMQLKLSEEEPEAVLKLFDELDVLTRKPFLKVKGEIDKRLGALYQIAPAELRPWHYHNPFFQEAPAVFDSDLDSIYADVDIVDLCKRFYDGMGVPIDKVIEKSDLYEKKGKSPHAFCTDIDRAGDVRVLANIVPNAQWARTSLHELGHSIYSSLYMPKDLPYLLRIQAHILTTEGLAMLFERFSRRGDWLTAMGVKVKDPEALNKASNKVQQAELLVFSRWAQVMFRFEKGLYENPGQDLNKLWWDLVENYQGLKRPEGRNAPDYAAKIHIVSAPAYYHNYLLGQLFASQVHHAVAKQVLKVKDPRVAQYVGNKKVGEYFKTKVIAPGARYPWNELTKFATGEPLNAKAFAADLTD